MSEMTFFYVFFAFWVLLGTAGFLLFHVKQDVAFKRRYFPVYMIGAAMLFVAFVATVIPGWRVLAFMLPAVALITWLNLRGTRFCSACGRTVTDPFPIRRAQFCSRCGASLGTDGGAS